MLYSATKRARSNWTDTWTAREFKASRWQTDLAMEVLERVLIFLPFRHFSYSLTCIISCINHKFNCCFIKILSQIKTLRKSIGIGRKAKNSGFGAVAYCVQIYNRSLTASEVGLMMQSCVKTTVWFWDWNPLWIHNYWIWINCCNTTDSKRLHNLVFFLSPFCCRFYLLIYFHCFPKYSFCLLHLSLLRQQLEALHILQTRVH